MNQQNTKLAIAAIVVAAAIAGIFLINRPENRRVDKPKANNNQEESGSRKPGRALSGSVDKVPTTTTANAAVAEKQPLPNYGLPELTMENVDINPERPADMPVADWEEYERKRFQMVQMKAYKFRETDPEKVVPYEVVDIVPEAARKYNVPVELLAALLYTSSNGGHHYAEHDIEGGFGLMMLKESPQCNSLAEAAELLGANVEDVIYNQRLNVHGGAAVLRQYYEDAIATGVGESEAWYMAVAQYSGRPQPVLAADLADQVAGNMMKGFEIDSEDGSGYYKQDPNPTPLFLPKNWKIAAVDPPAGTPEKSSTSPEATPTPAPQ